MRAAQVPKERVREGEGEGEREGEREGEGERGEYRKMDMVWLRILRTRGSDLLLAELRKGCACVLTGGDSSMRVSSL